MAFIGYYQDNMVGIWANNPDTAQSEASRLFSTLIRKPIPTEQVLVLPVER
jgi:hypothetical protein